MTTANTTNTADPKVALHPNCSAWQDCLQHAFEEAAVGIENWEYAGYESEEEKVMTFKAAKAVAKLIRAMAWRRYLAHHRKQNEKAEALRR